MLIKLVIISQNGTRSIPRTNIENNDSSFTPPEKLTFDNIPLQRNPQKFYSSDSERERERAYPQTYSRFCASKRTPIPVKLVIIPKRGIRFPERASRKQP